MNVITIKNTVELKYLYLDSDGKSIGLIEFQNKLASKKIDSKSILAYHDVLLFISAHPINIRIKSWATKELRRIEHWCKINKKKHEEILDNSGLVHSNIYSFFSYEFVHWLNEKKQKISIENYPEEESSLNEVFIHTLPASERDIVLQELNNLYLLSALDIEKDMLLDFIMGQFSKLDGIPSVRDYLFEKQKFGIKLETNTRFSKSGNRIYLDKVFIHKDWIKKVNTAEWIKHPLPEEKKLQRQDRNEILQSSRIKLALLQRETDPVTYMDSNSIRYFPLERGISVALFTMKTDKQLYPESYIGYTLYKNGYPAAYGGAWIFGRHALIGVNIFEWFRGGESVLFFIQLLRLYHQQFNVVHFEVEPYQFGKDNPEGIKSGAFWFYYRMGFRPIDRQLALLAHKEAEKIKINRTYRSPKRILVQFTESNLRLSMEKERIIEGCEIKNKITSMVVNEFSGDRLKAEISCMQWLKTQTKGEISFNNLNVNVLSELALMNRACRFPIVKHSTLITNMLHNKARDLYQYQANIMEWLKIYQHKN